MSRALCCDKYCACMLEKYTLTNQATVLLLVYLHKKSYIYIITPFLLNPINIIVNIYVIPKNEVYVGELCM